MKKLLQLFLFTFSIIVQSQTFVTKSLSNPISGIRIEVFENGVRIDSENTNASGEATFNLTQGNTYSYRTDTNFSGVFIASMTTIELDHATYTFIVKDDTDQPRDNIEVEIFFQGKEMVDDDTNVSGEAIFYLKPSCNYAYRVQDIFTGVVTTNENSLQETINVQINSPETFYRVNFIATDNENLPIADSYILTSNNGDFSERNSSSSTNGLFTYDLLSGDYTLTSRLGGKVAVQVIDQELTIPLDFKKITFKNVDENLNLLNTIRLENINSRFTRDFGFFDAKNEVICYLLPGTYRYKFAGKKEVFTVTEDAIIEIETKQIALTLRNVETAAVYPFKKFYVDCNGEFTDYVTDENGTVNLPFVLGNYQVYLEDDDDHPSVDFEVLPTTTAVEIPLLDFRINVNTAIPDFQNSYSLEYNDRFIRGNYVFGETYTLPKGAYRVSSPFVLDFNLDTTNEELTKSIHRLIIEIKTISGEQVVSGYSYLLEFLDGGTTTTLFSRNGEKITKVLSNGSYRLKNLATLEQWDVEILNGDVTIENILPNKVSFSYSRNGVEDKNKSILLYEDENFEGAVAVSTGNGQNFANLEVGSVKKIFNGVRLADYQIKQENNLEYFDLSVSTEGKGLAFPPASNQEVNYIVLKGSGITLSAVPMKDWVFEKWVINGTEIFNDQIEYTIDGITAATAVFKQGTLNIADHFQSGRDIPELMIYPNPVRDEAETTIFVEGNVTIYDVSGQVVKQVYMLGNKLNVSNLKSGVYLALFELNNGSDYSGKFIKQ